MTDPDNAQIELEDDDDPTLLDYGDKTKITLDVAVKNIDIPFFRMVMIILKWSLASIPALILLWVILLFVGLVLSAGGLLPA